VTPKHLALIRHTLGFPSDPPYRNYFMASEGSENYGLCFECVALGLMTQDMWFDAPGLPLFRATEAGMKAAKAGGAA
jgi:hypothetical protein